ncbi:DUF4870 domain-containing protein [Halococcus hamelinensis]|uniref:DUF4870 domain-containing protein n=1 Tax=Halococcus hamelinensis 100A6 TaxID=1132509 RepID=M0LUM2_9EURY|nr:DUF4870 domain-containing protein [Halococcus hamelinensis]EMA35795.1 hypothetical protein C447_16594 [Halococcus hamelinensis 100A6]
MASSTKEFDGETETTTTAVENESGLDSNVAGALSYVFGFVSGLIFYLIEKEDEFVRWHAAQSIALSAVVVAVSIGLSFVGTAISVATFSGSSGLFLVGSLLSLVLGLVWLAVTVGAVAVWLYLILRAYQGRTVRLPIVATLADRLV